MSDSIRAALERLLSDIQDLSDSSQGIVGLHRNGDPAPWNELLEGGRYSSWLGDAIEAARAALASDGPAVPESREPASVVGESIDDAELDELFTEIDQSGEALSWRAYARAVLARWGHQPTPPAEGEVRELVVWLRENAEDERQMCESSNRASLNLERAAELLQRQQAKIESLEQQLETERMRVVACGIIAMSDTPFSASKNRNCHPDYWSASADDIARQIDELMRLRARQTPVPVSERLPGDQLSWWYEPDEEDGYGGRWTLLRIRGGTGTYTHWLPANALPRPRGEVE